MFEYLFVVDDFTGFDRYKLNQMFICVYVCHLRRLHNTTTILLRYYLSMEIKLFKFLNVIVRYAFKQHQIRNKNSQLKKKYGFLKRYDNKIREYLYLYKYMIKFKRKNCRLTLIGPNVESLSFT